MIINSSSFDDREERSAERKMRFLFSRVSKILQNVQKKWPQQSHCGVTSDLRRGTPPVMRLLVTSPITKADAEMVDVTFIKADGTRLSTKGKIGDNLLDVVVNNDVDLDGFGACEGTLACSTCHLVFKKEDFDKIKEKVTDEELDMLDMAYGLCDTSRLGCQVCLTKELDGVEVIVPEGVNDARS